MNALASLKLTAEKRPNARLAPVVQRRNRLIAKIWEQTQLATAQGKGDTFVLTHSRRVKDRDTGEQRSVEVPKRIRPWWFTAENGKVCLNLKYGTKILELTKGKATVEVGQLSNLVAVLDTLKAAVAAGELDAQIDTASGKLRAGFARK